MNTPTLVASPILPNVVDPDGSVHVAIGAPVVDDATETLRVDDAIAEADLSLERAIALSARLGLAGWTMLHHHIDRPDATPREEIAKNLRAKLQRAGDYGDDLFYLPGDEIEEDRFLLFLAGVGTWELTPRTLALAAGTTGETLDAMADAFDEPWKA